MSGRAWGKGQQYLVIVSLGEKRLYQRSFFGQPDQLLGDLSRDSEVYSAGLADARKVQQVTWVLFERYSIPC
jgi:hypothetical protein